MTHKLLVTRLVPNAGHTQATTPDGKLVTEKIFVQKQQIVKAAVVDQNDKHLRGASGEHLFSDIITTTIEEEERPLIPDYISDHQFHVFQELDATGANLVRYYTEDGKDFVFENDDDIRYEAKIIERNIKQVPK